MSTFSFKNYGEFSDHPLVKQFHLKELKKKTGIQLDLYPLTLEVIESRDNSNLIGNSNKETGGCKITTTHLRLSVKTVSDRKRWNEGGSDYIVIRSKTIVNATIDIYATLDHNDLLSGHYLIEVACSEKICNDKVVGEIYLYLYDKGEEVANLIDTIRSRVIVSDPQDNLVVYHLGKVVNNDVYSSLPSLTRLTKWLNGSTTSNLNGDSGVITSQLITQVISDSSREKGIRVKDHLIWLSPHQPADKTIAVWKLKDASDTSDYTWTETLEPGLPNSRISEIVEYGDYKFYFSPSPKYYSDNVAWYSFFDSTSRRIHYMK